MSYQKKITPIRATLLKRLLFMMLCLSVIACNTNDNNSATSLDKITADSKKPAELLSAGTFSYLKLPKDSLVKLFADANGNPNGGTVKVLLQFVDDNTASNVNPINLIAYGATARNRKTSGPIYLTIETTPAPANLSGIKFLGNLELSRNKLNNILGNQGNPPIGSNNSKDLYFQPAAGAGNYINYVLYYISQNPYTGDTTLINLPPPTNPSPPADPCDPCDQ